MRLVPTLLLGALLLASVSDPTVAVGQSSTRDIAVAVNTFNFVTPAVSSARVAVVHDGGASRADAQRIAQSMPARVRRIDISATPISVNEIGSSNANIFILASGLSSGSLSSVRSQLAGSGRLCVTTQRGYVESGACVMAVSSSPEVNIVVSNSTAQRFGVRFAAALLMMVEEI